MILPWINSVGHGGDWHIWTSCFQELLHLAVKIKNSFEKNGQILSNTNFSLVALHDIILEYSFKMTKSKWSTGIKKMLSMFHIYNICSWTLNHCMNPYSTIQMNKLMVTTFLWLALNEVSQGCLVRAVTVGKQAFKWSSVMVERYLNLIIFICMLTCINY